MTDDQKVHFSKNRILYRRKNTHVAAVQWFPDPSIRMTGYDAYGVEYTITGMGIWVYGTCVKIDPGDWLIADVKGNLYVFKDDVFRETYDFGSVFDAMKRTK